MKTPGAILALIHAGYATQAWELARPFCGEKECCPTSPGFMLMEREAYNFAACAVGKDTIVFDLDDESFSITGGQVTKVDQATQGARAIYAKASDSFFASFDKAKQATGVAL